MASAFKEPIEIVGYRLRTPSVVYIFESANKAAEFTKADVKSILQVARGERKTAVGWSFFLRSTIGGQVVESQAVKRVYKHEMIVA